jgi:hypothetical protein
MPTTFTAADEVAIEQSTYAIVVTFADETGAALTPNIGLTWTLTDKSGTVVNERLAVPIDSAAEITIVLSGDDLSLDSVYRGKSRVVLVEGAFDSDLGDDLPIKDQVTFTIANLVAVV